MCTICLCSVHQIKLVSQKYLLHTNKNALIPLSRKSTVRPCLFICWRNLISESLCVALASLSIIIVCRTWPPLKPSEPRRKPLLVLGTDPYIYALSLQVTGDFSHLCLGLRPSSAPCICVWAYVCVIQKCRKATGRICRGMPDRLTNTSTDTKNALTTKNQLSQNVFSFLLISFCLILWLLSTSSLLVWASLSFLYLYWIWRKTERREVKGYQKPSVYVEICKLCKYLTGPR